MTALKLVSHAAPLTVAPASVKAARLSLARSESTLFPTRLALARWTAGGTVPHLHSDLNPPLRAAWFARAQRDFQAWIDAGGFVQHDDDVANDADMAGVNDPAVCFHIAGSDGDAI